MTEIKTTKIPRRQKCVDKDHPYIGGSVDILDDNKNKTQEQINSETEERVSTLEESVGTGGSVDERIAEEGAKHYLKTETYSKTELNNLITTPNQGFVTVTATDETTDVTDVLPETGSADTTYRVGNWDGTQYNDSVFSEYAWNGSAYIKLSTKSQIGEVYDISVNHAGATYADLAAALGTNGANIPQSLRKGGMSVKFVQTSDNKYVQFFCIANEFTTDTTKWAICNNGMLKNSPDFIKVELDAEGKVLWAIDKDGKIYFGAGIPPQIIQYVEGKVALLNGNIAAITAFLDGFSTTTLKDYLNNAYGKYIEDADNRIKIDLDSEDKIVSYRDNSGKLHENVGIEAKEIITERFIADSIFVKNTNQWFNKKCIFFGTSTGWGSNATKSFAKIAFKNLGFGNVIPACIPGLATEIEVSQGGIPYPKTYGSSTLSKAEYAAAKDAGLSTLVIPETPIAYSMDTWHPGSWDYNMYYGAYDNIFTQENADTDLFVFAIGGNNGSWGNSDWELFNPSTWSYTDGSTFAEHRKTFIGSLLFLLNQMYQLNTNARCVLVIESAFGYSNVKSWYNTLSEECGMAVINLWGKMNLLKPSLDVLYSDGGTNLHPSTYAHELLGKMFTNELLLIS